jgi:hypothetical protein
MIAASLLIFIMIIRILISKDDFRKYLKVISLLSLIVVVFGMLLGKYGANAGLPWWIYYPVPLLMTLVLPPLVLRFNKRKTILYIVLSFLSAPFIHVVFSFFLGWTEYLPFWKLPYIGNMI